MASLVTGSGAVYYCAEYLVDKHHVNMTLSTNGLWQNFLNGGECLVEACWLHNYLLWSDISESGVVALDISFSAQKSTSLLQNNPN